MPDNPVSILSRIVFAVVIFYFGFNHVMNAGGLSDAVPFWLPGDAMWVYVSGACMMLAAIAFIMNRKVKLAGYLLGALLLIYVLALHLPGYLNASNAMERGASTATILKDTALAAGAFFIGSKSI